MKRITTVFLLVVGLIIVGCAKEPQMPSTPSTHGASEPQVTSTSSTPDPSGTTTTGATTTTNGGSTTLRIGGAIRDADPLSPDASLAWLTRNGYNVERNSRGGYSIRRNGNPNLIELDITGKYATVDSGAIGAIISIDKNGKLRVAPNNP